MVSVDERSELLHHLLGLLEHHIEIVGCSNVIICVVLYILNRVKLRVEDGASWLLVAV